jgi:hypothetical protein
MPKWILLVVLLAAPITSGCLAMAGLTVGAGVVGYVLYDKNEARRDFDASFAATWKATLAALRALEYTVPADPQHEGDSGALTLEDVRLRVAHHPGGKTRVHVRVGTFDTEEHRRRAGLILERIEKEL